MGTEIPTRPAARLHPLLRVAGYSLASAVGGMAFNILSSDYRWRAVRVALLIVAVAAVAGFLRGHVHPASILARRAPSVLLTLAGLAALATFVHRWTVPGTASAAGLVVAAVLIPIEIDTSLRLLGGAAVVGLGLASIGVGVSELHRSNVVVCVMIIGFGVGFIGFGTAQLRHSKVSLDVAAIDGRVTTPRRRSRWSGVEVIGLGVMQSAAGVAELPRGEILVSAAVIVGGVAVIGMGVARLRRNIALFGAAVIVGGVGTISFGVNMRLSGVLLAAAVIGFGVAVIGIGVAVLRHAGAVSRAWSWLAGLTRAPTQTASDPRTGMSVQNGEDLPSPKAR